MPEAILFDLDDTLVTWDAVADKVWRDVCKRFASRLDGLGAGILFDTIKQHRQWFYSDPERHRQARLNLRAARREVVSNSLEKLGTGNPELAVEMADAYGVAREKAACLITGAIDTLKILRNKGVKLALVSNGTSEVQRRKIKRFRLAHFFEDILIESEFGIGKPDERVFQHTLDKLEVSPNEVWMVGDDLERDIGGARRMGIYSIWVDWKGNGLPVKTPIKPDRIIRIISCNVSAPAGGRPVTLRLDAVQSPFAIWGILHIGSNAR